MDNGQLTISFAFKMENGELRMEKCFTERGAFFNSQLSILHLKSLFLQKQLRDGREQQ